MWDDDELMALRLRGDFGGASEFTLSQRVAGTEVSRATGQVAASSHGEIIYALPAAWVRQLPVVEVEVLLTAHEGGEERPIGSYTLGPRRRAAAIASDLAVEDDHSRQPSRRTLTGAVPCRHQGRSPPGRRWR